MTKKDFKIMIVGAGPAGISTWLHLHKYSPELANKTLIIDKATFPREKICGGALGGWTEQILSKLNIKVNIPSYFINKLVLKLEEQNEIINKKKFFRIVDRKEFDSTLLNEAKARGLIIQENEIFNSYKKNGENLIVKTNNDTYEIKILIGADGAFSSVRKWAFPDMKPTFSPGLKYQELCDSNSQEFSKNEATIDFSPILKNISGYMWSFPHYSSGNPVINKGIIDFKVGAKHNVNIRKLLMNNIDTKLVNTGEIKSYPIPWFDDKVILSSENVILVGDAAGIDPAIGGGIHLSLSYGSIAAKTIIDSITDMHRIQKYSDFFYQNMLGEYIIKLKQASKKMYSNQESTLQIAKKIFYNEL